MLSVGEQLDAPRFPFANAATFTVYKTREEWLDGRLGGIGSSDAPSILGVSQWSSKYTVWAEKTGKVQHREPETGPMRWGHKLEPAIADEYALVTGRQLIDLGPYVIVRSKECPCMCATHDRLVKATDRDGVGILSIKCAEKAKAIQWRDGAPLAYQVQLQHELAVTNARWGSFAVLFGGNDFRTFDVPRDEAFIAYLKRECFLFWQLVEREQQPAVDGSEATALTLRRMYPLETDAAVKMPSEALEWDAARRRAKELIAQAQDDVQLYENLIVSSIGSATMGEMADGTRYIFRTVKRKAYTVRASTVRMLRRVSAVSAALMDSPFEEDHEHEHGSAGEEYDQAQ